MQIMQAIDKSVCKQLCKDLYGGQHGSHTLLICSSLVKQVGKSKFKMDDIQQQYSKVNQN